jgi:hypothetical protein
MSLELVNTFASLATFLVIAATAIAAIVQLRHARSSNQIVAMNELLGAQQTPEYKEARHFVHTKLPELLKDPAFRHQLVAYMNKEQVRPDVETQIVHISVVADFYENLGLLVKRRFIDRESALDSWAYHLTAEWGRLEPAIVRCRRAAGNALWENFEYIVVLAQEWQLAYPSGTYPRQMKRIAYKDDGWAEADRQYEASLAPA